MTQPAAPPTRSAPLRQKLKPQNFVPTLTSGFVAGLLEAALAISFATLIFTGPLAEYRALGVGLALLGAILSSTVVALFTSLPGTLGGNQEVPAVIMTLIAAEIVLLIPAGATAAEMLLTVLAAIAITTLLTGTVFLALGYFKLGNLMRFLPYPVVGGFLAGTGWLLVTGALGIMVALPPELSSLPDLLQPAILIRWLPGVIIALTMLFWSRRSNNFLILPVIIVISLNLFYLAAWSYGLSVADLHETGWLLGPFMDGALWRPFPVTSLDLVHWPALAAQAAQIAAIVLVSTAGLLLNAGGLELATKNDMDLNRELRAAGWGNILSGLVPGLVGYQQLGLSAMNFKMGAGNRLTGLVAALVCIFALLFGGSILSQVPQVVVGGLLLFLGLSFLLEWVVETWFKLPKIDYSIVIAILLVTMAIGFLEAIVFGLLLAIVLFVVGYSRIEIVRHEFSAATYKSRLIRPLPQIQLLREKGECLYILQLQGFIFFGTADQLLTRVRHRLFDPHKLRPTAVYLDFSRVTGLDSTGLLSFSRMKQLTLEKGAALVFIDPLPRIQRQLERGGLHEDGDHLRFFSSLDRGIQWGEDRLLAGKKEGFPEITGSLKEHLAKILPRDTDIEVLLTYFEQREVEAGEKLISMGDPAEDMFIIGSGRVTAQIPRPNQPPIRLESTGSGNVVGEIGFYLDQKRTADVLVDEPGFVYCLSLANLERMEETDPEAAAALHRMIIHLLAERLLHLTQAFNALEQ
jgi:sulfate permease, SulP family